MRAADMAHGWNPRKQAATAALHPRRNGPFRQGRQCIYPERSCRFFVLSFDRSDPACPTCTPAPPVPFLVSPSSTRLVRLVTPINSASAASASPDRRTPCVRATRRSQRAAAIAPRNGPAIFHRRTGVHGNRQQRSNRRPCLSPAHRHAQGLKSPNTSLSSCQRRTPAETI